MLENKLKVITTTTQVKSNGVKKDSAVLVYKNKKGYEVHAVISRDVAYFRVSANVYIKTPDGRKSRYTTIQKSDVVCEKKNAFNYLLGLEGEFTNDDVNKIRRKMKEILSSDSEFVDEGEVFTPEELYQAVCDYIRENAMDKKTQAVQSFTYSKMAAPGEGVSGPALNTDYYKVNPNGQVGKRKTIDMAFANMKATNAMNHWDASDIIAQGVARDVCQAIKGVHERPIIDSYAIYAAYDDNYLPLRGHFPGSTGAPGQDASASLHQGRAPGSGALPDRLFQGSWLCRSTYRRSSLDQRTAGEGPRQGRKDRFCYPARGPGHFPSRVR